MADFPRHLGAHDRYRIESVFADSGGMGILYEAFDERCADNRVLVKTTRYDTGPRIRNFRYTRGEAVKFIRQARKILEWEKKVLVRFRNEGLNNIPSANDFFEERSLTLDERYEGKSGAYGLPAEVLDSEPYLVMEFIPGDLFEDRVTDPEFREHLEERLLSLAREILTIFIRLHKPLEVDGREAYFLYQDLKPANILVSDEDYFTLIDFGGVTMRLGGKTTEPTAACITTGYAAPEASDGNEAYIDRRFDLYTLGATLWQAVTLQDPRDLGAEFPHLDPMAMRGKGVSEHFVRLVAKALKPDPDERFQTAGAFRKAVMQRLREIRTSSAEE